MATPTTVDSAAIDAAAERILNGKKQVSDLADAARREFEGLSTSWTGDAGSQFQTVMGQFNDIFSRIYSKMDSMVADVKQAGGEYMKAGSAVEDGVRQLNVGLPGV